MRTDLTMVTQPDLDYHVEMENIIRGSACSVN